MTKEEEIILANQQALAAAIRSVALANSLSWASVAMLLQQGGVMPADKFAEITTQLAGLIETQAPAENAVGAAMLRQVHDILRQQNPPRWTPTVVDGGAA